MLTALVVAAAAAAVLVVQRNTPATQTAAAGAELGYLVYAAREAGGARLWVWNIAAGTVAPGPRVRAVPNDLSFAYAASSGWLSATVPVEHEADAVVLRSLEATAVAERVGAGDLVTWLPNGGFLSVATIERLDGCERSLSIRTSKVSADFTKRSLDTVVCGRPTMLGRDLTGPYVTVERQGTASVFRVNYRQLDAVLHGYRALSVSLNGDLLVQRPRGGGALFYYYASGEAPPPVPVARHGRPLIAERVLGWSGDASAVYVLGAIGGVRGVYRITVSPEVRPRAPALIAATDARDVSASPTLLGDVYVSADGVVSAVDDGEARPLSPPGGAPPVHGPLLWTSTLPYSRSETG